MHNGLIIALAWPETLCKQAGAWYDTPLTWLGINNNNYYKVGHSAIVLIEKKTGDCLYFDFGRYHTPRGYGRVRSAITDHDLVINTKAIISKKGIVQNYKELITEIFSNTSCHGSGNLHAAYCEGDFIAAQKKALQLQQLSPITYGPFLPNGSNCSRFVNKVILASKPNLIHRLLLMAPKTLTPTPIGNVLSLSHIYIKKHNTLVVNNKTEQITKLIHEYN